MKKKRNIEENKVESQKEKRTNERMKEKYGNKYLVCKNILNPFQTRYVCLFLESFLITDLHGLNDELLH